MVALVRKYIVVFLVILQGVLPLVHAHADGNEGQNGLHLYEFENLPVILDQIYLSAADCQLQADNYAVNIGSAINQQCHKQQWAYPAAVSSYCTPEPIAERVKFSQRYWDPVSHLYAELPSARSPPSPKSI